MIKNDRLDEVHENAGCLSRNILLFITAVALVVILAACCMYHIHCVREKALREIIIKE
ncbi:hypothetical protein GGR22_000395 [Flavobacterium gossypii]|uniref:Uncharacterized protein n=1 Tax=Flavobacterium gossypii TaxID=1646119 RepID=A0ABR6DLF7_9FLAO|nr:hypothetical protein [Flavobacterium gossypii]